jgi:hypothetical protein
VATQRCANRLSERGPLPKESYILAGAYPGILSQTGATVEFDSSFQDRLSRGSEAKIATLAKFKRALDPNNPIATEKRRQRETIVAARAERAAQREIARQEQERELARQAVLASEAAAEARRAAAEREAREAAEQAEREAALKVEQKTARDARYAARKAAKKERRRGY